MTRPLTLIIALASAALLSSCDSHSWEKETSQLFHKKGGHDAGHGAAAHDADHAPAAAPAHGEEKKH
jgi:hypothetical protein